MVTTAPVDTLADALRDVSRILRSAGSPAPQLAFSSFSRERFERIRSLPNARVTAEPWGTSGDLLETAWATVDGLSVFASHVRAPLPSDSPR
jgi:hypothetical protein